MKQDFPRWDVAVGGQERASFHEVDDALAFFAAASKEPGNVVSIWRVSGTEKGLRRLVYAALGVATEISPIMGYAETREGRVSLVLVDGAGTEHTLSPHDAGGDGKRADDAFVDPGTAMRALRLAMTEGVVPTDFPWVTVD
ncbi:MAG: hypothetical protein U0230_24955 [Polyangiales bacterium]